MLLQRRPRGMFLYLLFIFLVLALGIGFVGNTYYDHERDRIKRTTHDDLSAIAALKVNQIERWRNERLRDADVIMGTTLMAEAVNQWLTRPAKPQLEQTILTWMKAHSSSFDYTSVFLLDPKGVMRLRISKGEEPVGGEAQRLVVESLRSGKAILSDLYRLQNGSDIRIDLCVPLLLQSGRDIVPAGVLLLRTDPVHFLYPLIQSWPTPSPTAETLLVRREGDEVLFLNDLRHKHNTALTLRVPVKEQKLPAAEAARGEAGILEGVDYRGVPVLAAFRQIPDSPWFLVSKVDIDEIYAPIRTQFWMVLIIIILLITSAGVAIGLVRRQELIRFYQEAQQESERLIRERTAEITDANTRLESEIVEHRRTEEARRAAEVALEQQRVLHVRSDRLRSLGEMAAGIAHELNQPLVGVRGLAEHLLVAIKKGWSLTEEGAREKLNLIVEQADRMVHIIDHVRMFAKEAGKPQVKSVQVNDVVRSATEMLREQFKSRGVEMECDLMESLPAVSANPFSLEEVVLNLTVNARDAVVERLRDDPMAATRVLLRTSLDRNNSGQQVKIEVVDSGIGIHGDVLPRVFDPFFTTKDLDKGTGLGLSISRAIVEQFGGTIGIESALNQGTTVTIRLPVEEKRGEGER